LPYSQIVLTRDEKKKVLLRNGTGSDANTRPKK